VKLRTPELADLREATRTDGADISRAESAFRAISPGVALGDHSPAVTTLPAWHAVVSAGGQLRTLEVSSAKRRRRP